MIGIIIAVIALVVAGFGAFYFFKNNKVNSAEKLEEAERKATKVLQEARAQALDITKEASKNLDKRHKEVEIISDRLLQREKNLDKKQEEVQKKETEISEIRTMIQDIRSKQQEKLEKIAKLSKKEATEKLFKMVEKDISADIIGLVAKKQQEAQAEAEDNARGVLLSAMERMASEVTSERTITTVKLDNEDVKGRIIGKEGRNIQSLQKLTGVDILVDDTPGAIVLSCFDPIRREVARQTLEKLIQDGRIHPGRIEEILEKSQKNVHREVMKVAEATAREVGVIGIPPAILQLLGELRFRTSYGQNVLKHSLEMAQLAGVLAEQIGADTYICKYAALVHDLGKALTHKMEGKHHHLSGEMLRKYGVDEAIAHAAEAHHDDIEATTPEAMVIRVVDAVSAARPGARNASAENFIERMKTLENIANSFEGIDKSYAISAGREVRVFVKPGELNDLQSIQVARDIATKIESMANYPGTIKVIVLRETRAIEYAK